jgi:hypothetical protein
LATPAVAPARDDLLRSYVQARAAEAVGDEARAWT